MPAPTISKPTMMARRRSSSRSTIAPSLLAAWSSADTVTVNHRKIDSATAPERMNSAPTPAPDPNEVYDQVILSATSFSRAKFLAMDKAIAQPQRSAREELRRHRFGSKIAAFENGKANSRPAVPPPRPMTSSSKVTAAFQSDKALDVVEDAEDNDQQLVQTAASFSRAKFLAMDQEAQTQEPAFVRTTTWQQQGGASNYKKKTVTKFTQGVASKKSLADLP